MSTTHTRVCLYQHQNPGVISNFPCEVGWVKFNVPFQHKHCHIRDERSGVESYPLTQWRKASDILTSTPAAFLFSSHSKRERDREAHLNYYASAYNRGRQLSHRKTKLNQIQQNTNNNLNYHKINTNKVKTGLVASYDLWPGNGVGQFS